MTQLRCPNCGTIYDVSQYPPGHRFQCSCGRELEVDVTPTATASTTATGPVPSPPPGPDPGMQPIVKVLVFLANLCFSPLAALVSTIIYFVIRDQKPRTAKDLCQMTWIPFAIACVLWILYFVFVFGLAMMGNM
jgi:hypothetical protein